MTRHDCIQVESTCPCKDGDLCHYVDDPVTGTKAMRCKRCGNSPVVAEVEGRTLVCVTCRDDEAFREHAKKDYR